MQYVNLGNTGLRVSRVWPIVRSAGSSIPDHSSNRSSILRPSRSSAIDSTGTGSSGRLTAPSP